MDHCFFKYKTYKKFDQLIPLQVIKKFAGVLHWSTENNLNDVLLVADILPDRVTNSP